jgi:hypothetical protein
MRRIILSCRDCHRKPTWVLCGVHAYPYVCGYHRKKYAAAEIQTMKIAPKQNQ